MKILIVGLGSIGQRHLKNILDAGKNEVIALRTGKGTKNLELPVTCFSDAEEAFSQQPEAAFICNPSSMHVDTALMAARNGCHLFIEKPLAHNFDRINDLKQIVTEKKLITFVAYNLRFHPAMLKIKELVENNFLGKIWFARSEFASYLPSWHPWEDYKESYASKRDLGGGVILTSSHELDILLWLFGEYEKVSVMKSKGEFLGIDAESLALMHLRFKNNVYAEVNLNYIRNPHKRYIEIIGEKGMLYFDFYERELKFFSRMQKTFESWETLLVSEEDAMEKTYVSEVDHFIECVERNQNPVCSLDVGERVLKLALDALP